MILVVAIPTVYAAIAYVVASVTLAFDRPTIPKFAAFYSSPP